MLAARMLLRNSAGGRSLSVSGTSSECFPARSVTVPPGSCKFGFSRVPWQCGDPPVRRATSALKKPSPAYCRLHSLLSSDQRGRATSVTSVAGPFDSGGPCNGECCPAGYDCLYDYFVSYGGIHQCCATPAAARLPRRPRRSPQRARTVLIFQTLSPCRSKDSRQRLGFLLGSRCETGFLGVPERYRCRADAAPQRTPWEGPCARQNEV